MKSKNKLTPQKLSLAEQHFQLHMSPQKLLTKDLRNKKVIENSKIQDLPLNLPIISTAGIVKNDDLTEFILKLPSKSQIHAMSEKSNEYLKILRDAYISCQKELDTMQTSMLSSNVTSFDKNKFYQAKKLYDMLLQLLKSYLFISKSPELDVIFRKQSAELPVSLFDASKWDPIIKIANEYNMNMLFPKSIAIVNELEQSFEMKLYAIQYRIKQSKEEFRFVRDNVILDLQRMSTMLTTIVRHIKPNFASYDQANKQKIQAFFNDAGHMNTEDEVIKNLKHQLDVEIKAHRETKILIGNFEMQHFNDMDKIQSIITTIDDWNMANIRQIKLNDEVSLQDYRSLCMKSLDLLTPFEASQVILLRLGYVENLFKHEKGFNELKFEQEIASYNNMIDELKTSLVESDNTIRELSMQLEETRTQSAFKIDDGIRRAVQAEKQFYESKIKEIMGRYDELQDKLDSNMKELSTISSQNYELKNIVIKLETLLEVEKNHSIDYKDVILKQEDKISSLENDIVLLETSKRELVESTEVINHNNNSQREEMIKDFQDAIRKLTSDLQEKETLIINLELQLNDKMNEEHSQAKVDKDEVDIKERLASEVIILQEQLSKSKDDHINTTKEVELLTNSNVILSKKVETLERELHNLRLSLEEAKVINENISLKVIKANEKLREFKENTNSNANEEVEDVVNKDDDAVKELEKEEVVEAISTNLNDKGLHDVVSIEADHTSKANEEESNNSPPIIVNNESITGAKDEVIEEEQGLVSLDKVVSNDPDNENDDKVIESENKIIKEQTSDLVEGTSNELNSICATNENMEALHEKQSESLEELDEAKPLKIEETNKDELSHHSESTDAINTSIFEHEEDADSFTTEAPIAIEEEINAIPQKSDEDIAIIEKTQASFNINELLVQVKSHHSEYDSLLTIVKEGLVFDRSLHNKTPLVEFLWENINFQDLQSFMRIGDNLYIEHVTTLEVNESIACTLQRIVKQDISKKRKSNNSFDMNLPSDDANEVTFLKLMLIEISRLLNLNSSSMQDFVSLIDEATTSISIPITNDLDSLSLEELNTRNEELIAIMTNLETQKSKLIKLVLGILLAHVHGHSSRKVIQDNIEILRQGNLLLDLISDLNRMERPSKVDATIEFLWSSVTYESFKISYEYSLSLFKGLNVHEMNRPLVSIVLGQVKMELTNSKQSSKEVVDNELRDTNILKKMIDRITKLIQDKSNSMEVIDFIGFMKMNIPQTPWNDNKEIDQVIVFDANIRIMAMILALIREDVSTLRLKSANASQVSSETSSRMNSAITATSSTSISLFNPFEQCNIITKLIRDELSFDLTKVKVDEKMKTLWGKVTLQDLLNSMKSTKEEIIKLDLMKLPLKQSIASSILAIVKADIATLTGVSKPIISDEIKDLIALKQMCNRVIKQLNLSCMDTPIFQKIIQQVINKEPFPIYDSPTEYLQEEVTKVNLALICLLLGIIRVDIQQIRMNSSNGSSRSISNRPQTSLPMNPFEQCNILVELIQQHLVFKVDKETININIQKEKLWDDVTLVDVIHSIEASRELAQQLKIKLSKRAICSIIMSILKEDIQRLSGMIQPIIEDEVKDLASISNMLQRIQMKIKDNIDAKDMSEFFHVINKFSKKQSWLELKSPTSNQIDEALNYIEMMMALILGIIRVDMKQIRLTSAKKLAESHQRPPSAIPINPFDQHEVILSLLKTQFVLDSSKIKIVSNENISMLWGNVSFHDVIISIDVSKQLLFDMEVQSMRRSFSSIIIGMIRDDFQRLSGKFKPGHVEDENKDLQTLQNMLQRINGGINYDCVDIKSFADFLTRAIHNGDKSTSLGKKALGSPSSSSSLSLSSSRNEIAESLTSSISLMAIILGIIRADFKQLKSKKSNL